MFKHTTPKLHIPRQMCVIWGGGYMFKHTTPKLNIPRQMCVSYEEEDTCLNTQNPN